MHDANAADLSTKGQVHFLGLVLSSWTLREPMAACIDHGVDIKLSAVSDVLSVDVCVSKNVSKYTGHFISFITRLYVGIHATRRLAGVVRTKAPEKGRRTYLGFLGLRRSFAQGTVSVLAAPDTQNTTSASS